MAGGNTILPEVNLYIKAGVDGERMGACPFCQRVYMVLLIKSKHNLLKFKVLRVSAARPPPEFKALGLKHLPAILHDGDGYDAVDDIIQYIDQKFAGGQLEYRNASAELATKDFFSRFCFFVKTATDDTVKLIASLDNLNNFLEQHFATQTLTEENLETQYLCSESLSHLDCEVLPKLQHLRVAAKALKNFDIPTRLKGVWRYLHTAYTDSVFATTCPCDQEIILHWHDRPQTPTLTHKMHAHLCKQNAQYSFDVPVRACLVRLTLQ